MEDLYYLIVVDAQNDFIDGALGTKEAQDCVPKICEKIKNFRDDGLVILTKDTHNSNYLSTNEGIALPVKHCIEGTHGWGINDSVMKAYVERILKLDSTYVERILKLNSNGVNFDHFDIINKPTFGSERLYKIIDDDLELKGDGWTTLHIEIVGFCTDICVITNALILKTHFYNNAEIIVDSSCCAGVTPEKHNAALEVMKSCQIKVI